MKKKKKNGSNIPKYFLILLILISSLVTIIKFSGDRNVEPTYEYKNKNLSSHKIKFINTILPESKNVQKKYHILPSITIGQAILESDWGESTLSKKYHNLYGIKANHPKDSYVILKTKEYKNNKAYYKKAKFKKYHNYNESIDDHSKLLKYGTSWNSKQYKEVINAVHFKKAALELQESGYATDPVYTKKLIILIQKYKLDQFD
ncbi:mannosyl-glycoprotein endo-beta-N-acetylglucosamidase [Lactobacillus sp. S2-2]|uniref:glycoside hydrolase family 73 protein n=1 Tax=Lactobacillus sp. S2-2 TaxID=2692917 RepID=UPI001F03276E|nr:glucosaminidase domain-containing protein [Lactobacillus sp. S2-2]MCF6514801.1 mannosyl-glycoprotein endo-beta-N-acetylglucosamidase [Lactobacillus sp. S2-2]